LLQFWVGTNAFTVHLLDPVVYASGVTHDRIFYHKFCWFSLPRARGRKRVRSTGNSIQLACRVKIHSEPYHSSCVQISIHISVTNMYFCSHF